MPINAASGRQRGVGSGWKYGASSSTFCKRQTKYIACADEGSRVHKEASVVVNNMSLNGIKGQYTVHRNNKAGCMSSFQRVWDKFTGGQNARIWGLVKGKEIQP